MSSIDVTDVVKRRNQRCLHLNRVSIEFELILADRKIEIRGLVASSRRGGADRASAQMRRERP